MEVEEDIFPISPPAYPPPPHAFLRGVLPPTWCCCCVLLSQPMPTDLHRSISIFIPFPGRLCPRSVGDTQQHDCLRPTYLNFFLYASFAGRAQTSPFPFFSLRRGGGREWEHTFVPVPGYMHMPCGEDACMPCLSACCIWCLGIWICLSSPLLSLSFLLLSCLPLPLHLPSLAF